MILTQNLKKWPFFFRFNISFDSSLQNTVLPSLRLLFCACYQVDLDDIQRNEVATLTAHDFSNSWSLYLIFLNMINLCPNIWFIKNSKCQQFFHLKKQPPKKTQIFHIFKRLLFRNGEPYWYECWRILRDFCGLSRKCGFAIFPEI